MSDNQNPSPEETTRGCCEAHGCPLPGVWKTGMGMLCFIHSTAGCDLQATTERIRAHAFALRIVFRASVMPVITWDNGGRQQVEQALAKASRLDLYPEHGERPMFWLMRVRAILRKECLVLQGGQQLEADIPVREDFIGDLKRFAKWAPPVTAGAGA